MSNNVLIMSLKTSRTVDDPVRLGCVLCGGRFLLAVRSGFYKSTRTTDDVNDFFQIKDSFLNCHIHVRIICK